MNKINKAHLIAFGLMLTAATPAFTQSFESVRENCRTTVGRPIVQGCMAGQKGPPTEACRAKASPSVKACVQRAFADIGARKGTPATPKLDEDQVADATSGGTTASFVAPPRTIADITAILDNEKPDAAKIKERQEEADAEPPKNASRSDLAEF